MIYKSQDFESKQTNAGYLTEARHLEGQSFCRAAFFLPNMLGTHAHAQSCHGLAYPAQPCEFTSLRDEPEGVSLSLPSLPTAAITLSSCFFFTRNVLTLFFPPSSKILPFSATNLVVVLKLPRYIWLLYLLQMETLILTHIWQ